MTPGQSASSVLLRSVGAGLQLADGRWLFRHLHWTLRAGDSVHVSGPSGSGKTQWLLCLAGLRALSEGHLLRGSTPEGAVAPTQWRRAFRYVSPHASALDESPRVWWTRIESWIGSASSPASWASRWGLPADSIEQPWSELSHGEAQRWLLALALASEPDVLLLDEATTGLDAESRERVEADLRGRTAVWVTHDAAQAARMCSRTLPFALTHALAEPTA